MKHPFSRFFSFGEKEQEEMEKQEKEEIKKFRFLKLFQTVSNRGPFLTRKKLRS